MTFSVPYNKLYMEAKMLYTLKKVTDETLSQIAEEYAIRGTQEVFLLFSLGSQFDHLIKQMLEKLGVFCLVADGGEVKAEDVLSLRPKGIILSGGPVSVYKDKILFDAEILNLGIPVLGICLGFQLWARHIGASVSLSSRREFGSHPLVIHKDGSELFSGCASNKLVLESHGDKVMAHGKLDILASTENSPVAAARFAHLYGVQFHPEVSDTEDGRKIFENFCFTICGAKDRYPAEKIAQEKIENLRKKIHGKKILLALSGGSDSSVVAYLLKSALHGSSGLVQAVYIKGIDRPDDEANVITYFGNEDWMELRIVDATRNYLTALQGKISMVEKRIAVRGIYKAILEEEAIIFGAYYIAQGTLYTDISESGGGYDVTARKAQIKLHHNVKLGFSLEELTPLDGCVKDGARNIGRTIGVPEHLLVRHPFPGPGLTIRIEGEVTAEKLAIARQADSIYIDELRASGLYDSIWQAGAVVTQSVHTCTKGDDAVSGYLLVYWAVWSINGFTARSADLPYDFRCRFARRITNEIREIGAVAYRDSDKPPATIEWG